MDITPKYQNNSISKLLPMNIPNKVSRDNIMMINLEQMEFTYGRKNESVDTIEWKEKKGSSI